MQKVHIVRVFVDEKGKFGNPVGIVLDEKKKISQKERLKIAAKLNFSETVFINNAKTGNISIFNPIEEHTFAGHAIIGTAWFIKNKLGKNISSIECGEKQTKVWKKDDLTWIQAKISITPPWNHKQLQHAALIDNLIVKNTSLLKHLIIWAWKNEKEGIIRARTFAPDWGIPEDEANGSGSMQLAANLKRNLTIFHGKGSIIYAKNNENGEAEVGGRAVEDVSSPVIVNTLMSLRTPH